MKKILIFTLIIINSFAFSAQKNEDPAQIEKFMQAIKWDDQKTVNEMLESGFDINATNDRTGLTPLITAISSSQFKIANLLLDNNADVNKASHVLQTPLMFAARNPKTSPAFIKRLLNLGANINAKSAARSDVLWNAIYGALNAEELPNINNIKILLKNGANYKTDKILKYLKFTMESIPARSEIFKRAKEEVIKEYADKIAAYNNKFSGKIDLQKLPKDVINYLKSFYIIPNYQGEQILDNIIKIRQILGEISAATQQAQQVQQQASPAPQGGGAAAGN